MKISVVSLLLALSPLAFANSDIKDAWLSQTLYGNDNEYAALRRVTITEENGGYKIFIANQFTFLCDLEFSESGNPAFLNNCKTTAPENANWFTPTTRIPLKCTTSKVEHLCKGWYRLQSGEFGDRTELVIARAIQ